jgi:hypothetical protein
LTKSIISRTSPPLDRHLREGGHLLEVAEPLLDAVLDVAVGLLARLGDVHEPDEAPLRAIDRGAEGLRALLHHVPVVGQRVEARLGQRGADREQADAVAPGQARAGGRGDGGHRHVHGRLGVRAQVQPRVDELVGGRLDRHRLVAGQQAHDDVEVDVHQLARVGGAEAEHGAGARSWGTWRGQCGRRSGKRGRPSSGIGSHGAA